MIPSTSSYASVCSLYAIASLVRLISVNSKDPALIWILLVHQCRKLIIKALSNPNQPAAAPALTLMHLTTHSWQLSFNFLFVFWFISSQNCYFLAICHDLHHILPIYTAHLPVDTSPDWCWLIVNKREHYLNCRSASRFYYSSHLRPATIIAAAAAVTAALAACYWSITCH